MRGLRKRRLGTVSKLSSEKTVTVVVNSRRRHPVYNKVVTVSQKYHAHCEDPQIQVGDFVEITETRPLSKTKRWRVSDLLK
ncbi:MAG: 30S ribosomal protein S17, partial [Candidatus Margulisiibacteriota bacterium]